MQIIKATEVIPCIIIFGFSMYVVISLLIVIIIFMSISKGITASIRLPQLPLYYTPSALICKDCVVFLETNWNIN